MAMTSSDVLERWQGQEYVPLPDLARLCGMTKNAIQYSREHGLITPVEKKGPNGRHLITWEQALLIVAAATLAAAAGLAIATALQALRGAGAQVSGDVVTIPLLAVAA